MKTYEDLMECTSEQERAEFVEGACRDFASSPAHKVAETGEAYYNKHNVTIEQYKKFLYTLSGNKREDIFSSNYKLKTLFFRRLVTQQVQYLLGNGVALNDSEEKKKLGKSFDYKIQEAAKMAMTGGCAFGFWNYDHLEVFGYANTEQHAGFCPLYSEVNAELRAGIRFWRKKVGDTHVDKFTLYEEDGMTDYVKTGSDPIQQVSEKRGYITLTKSTEAEGTTETYENYGGRLPIVPLFANDTHESEIVGLRESIDCYDLVKSGLANDIDDTSGFFWVVKNSGGMDDVDLAQFIQRIKTARAASVSEDDQVEAHTLDVPTEARRTMLEILRADIYEDAQLLDVKTNLSAAAKTTQEIQAAYQAQDNKCNDFEYFIIEFCQRIMTLAGIPEDKQEITLIRDKVINQKEQTEMVMTAANYLSDETVLRHLPWLTPEEVEQNLDVKAERDLALLNAQNNEIDDEQEEDDE